MKTVLKMGQAGINVIVYCVVSLFVQHLNVHQITLHSRITITHGDISSWALTFGRLRMLVPCSEGSLVAPVSPCGYEVNRLSE